MTEKILIVEDEEEILELLTALFGVAEDYEILYAKNGEEALRTVQADSPDIILLDIQLPGLSGYEVCKSIKSDPVTSSIKIIMVTGMAQNTDLQKAQEVGADAYFTKPFDSVALVKKVEELLRNK